MSGNEIQPISGTDASVDAWREGGPPADWQGGESEAPESSGLNIGRYISALNRFKWLIVLATILGGAGGYGATKFLVPEYVVNATIILEQGTGTGAGGRGPIQGEELLKESGWKDLLTSYIVADPVVNDLALFVKPNEAKDSTLFQSFRVGQTLQPGEYTLTVNGRAWSLALNPSAEVDRGVVGDSIGRNRGFLWQPTLQDLAGRTEIGFNVQTPREASRDLINNLQMILTDKTSAFLKLELTGSNAGQAARSLNRWTDEFVSVATALKKQNVATFAAILEGQRAFAAEDLTSAENALERFRVQTVTEPTERPQVAAGLELTTNPMYGRYFDNKVRAEGLQRDREALEKLLPEGRQKGFIATEAALSIPSVNMDPAAAEVRSALAEQSSRELALRRIKERFQDEAKEVKVPEEQLEQVRKTVVPLAIERYLAQLRAREAQLNIEIERSGTELKSIPARTIQEQQLKRRVEVADVMYRNLDLKSAEAKMAEAQTIPDIRVLDSAVAPLRPTKNTAPMLILGATGAGLALGFMLAILLDRLDKRFRYPEQATDDLGLFILGVVPVISSKSRRSAVDQAAQVVESFRSIRMNVRYAADPSRPLAITITSPGPNDGKSLISSNLALSFAESGARTLLIDGDIRRGELSKTFGVTTRPGLVEYLDGTALIAEVLHPAAAHANLTIMPGGARRRRAPELLATPRLNQLIHQMSSEYDVVIVDSPPLGAGYDAYALATATGNMALVLRAGITDRRMAAAKMSTVHTLPIRIMGAVLNGIKMTGVYQYYSYYQDYAAEDEPTTPRLGKGADSKAVTTVSSR